MSLIKRMRKQKASYWEPTGESDPSGNPLYKAPVEIDCRWEDAQEMFVTPTGDEAVSKARVYVDRNVKLDGVLRLGELNTVTNTTDPLANEDSYVIRAFNNLPKLNAKEFLKWAML